MMVVTTSYNVNNQRRFQTRCTGGQVSHLRARDTTRQARVVPRSDPYPRITPETQPASTVPRRSQAASTVQSRPPLLQAIPEDNTLQQYHINTRVAPKAPPPSLPQAPHPRIPKAPPLSPPKAPPPASLPKAPPPELSPPPVPRNKATCVFCYDRSPTHAFVHAEGTSGDIADLVSHPLICRECLSRAQKKAPTSLARCPVCRVDSLMLIPNIQ